MRGGENKEGEHDKDCQICANQFKDGGMTTALFLCLISLERTYSNTSMHSLTLSLVHTHIHTHSLFIYIYIYISHTHIQGVN